MLTDTNETLSLSFQATVSGKCRFESVTSELPLAAIGPIAIANLNHYHGLVGIPTTGGPPVTGKKRLPPTGMPMRGAPPVAGTIKRGPVFSSCGGDNVVTAAEADLASS
jgi:hypothetical protein